MGMKKGHRTHSHPYPWIVAHRGAHDRAPENTFPAFDAAIAAKADGIEFDVQLSADDVPVIWHDRTLARIGAGRRHVSDLAVSDLERLNVARLAPGRYGRTGLATLPEVLARYGGRTNLLVEVKSRKRDRQAGRHRRLTNLVLKDLAEANVKKGSAFLLSFDREVLAEAHRLKPRLPLVLNIEDPLSIPTAKELQRLPLTACCLPVRRLSIAAGRKLRKRGLGVMTYACNRPHQVRRALAAGADVILSDVPEKARRFLRQERPR